MKLYYATHKLGRAHICTADADAIVGKCNQYAEENGLTKERSRVQAKLDELCDRVTQVLLKIEIEESQEEGE